MSRTRNSASRAKAHRESLSSLCLTIIEKTKQNGFFQNPSVCVSSYLKLTEYRTAIAEIRESEAQHQSETPEEFKQAEEIDHQCLLIAEKRSLVLVRKGTGKQSRYEGPFKVSEV